MIKIENNSFRSSWLPHKVYKDLYMRYIYSILIIIFYLVGSRKHMLDLYQFKILLKLYF